MLLIYWLEDHPRFGERVGEILMRMQERQDELLTSAFAVGEVLSGPYKRGVMAEVARVEEVMHSQFIAVLPFTIESVGHYARIRARLGVKPADAIHLACAAEAKVDLFLTNDSMLVGKVVPGIQFIAGLNTDLL
jgi:predicted nucleic acid-binding protein